MASAQTHVRFVVTGDDRWNTKAPRPGLDENGVNVTAVKKLAAAIVAEKPQALLFNGDLVGGGETDEAEASQFETWKTAMAPIYDAGIKVLAARGNHEMHCPHPDDAWRKALTGKYANPQDGPAGEEGMTYAYSIGNCLFIALDQFKGPALGVNQSWLDQTLKEKHAQHVFAFAHKMAFFSGNHDDGMDTVPDARDALMKSLMSAGAHAVFFGHDHLYDHVEARIGDADDQHTIHQFVIGTAGAPFVKGKPLPDSDGIWKLKRLGHVEQKLGYGVVDVDGPKVTIVYKSEDETGKFVPVDTYTYTLKD